MQTIENDDRFSLQATPSRADSNLDDEKFGPGVLRSSSQAGSVVGSLPSSPLPVLSPVNIEKKQKQPVPDVIPNPQPILDPRSQKQTFRRSDMKAIMSNLSVRGVDVNKGRFPRKSGRGMSGLAITEETDETLRNEPMRSSSGSIVNEEPNSPSIEEQIDENTNPESYEV